MSGFFSSALDTLRGYAGSTAWVPLVRISCATVLSLLRRIEFGCFCITDETGSETRCGSDLGLGSHVYSTPPRAGLNVKPEVFWVRLALFTDIVYQIGS